MPVQNVLSVILLELCREGGRLSIKKVFGGVIKNPYVIAAQLVVFTSLFSLLTIFLWIFGLTRLRVLV